MKKIIFGGKLGPYFDRRILFQMRTNIIRSHHQEILPFVNIWSFRPVNGEEKGKVRKG